MASRRRNEPFTPISAFVGCKGKNKYVRVQINHAKEMKEIISEGISEEGNKAASIWNNPDLRAIVLSESKKGNSCAKIAEIAKESGFTTSPNSINQFLNKRMNLLSKGEIIEVKDSIFYDIEKLDRSIDKIVKLLEEKIESWKDDNKKTKDLILYISQLKDYQILAMKKLGIIKDAIQKVDRQFNQTNIIVAQHQTDYLKELVMDGKIKIVDSTLLDLVFGKAVNNDVNHGESIPAEAKEGEKVNMTEKVN